MSEPLTVWLGALRDWVGSADVGATVYSGLIDIILALLPWPILLKLGASPSGLELSIKEKIGVALAMSMGVV